MAVGGNFLRALSPTSGFAPDNRRRQHGLASRPAYRIQDGAQPTCYKVQENQTQIVQQTSTQYPFCFGGSLFSIDGGLEGIANENGQVYKNVCDLYGLARVSGVDKEMWIRPHLVALKMKTPKSNDKNQYAFCGTQRCVFLLLRITCAVVGENVDCHYFFRKHNC